MPCNKEARHELEELGLLTVKSAFDHGRQIANTYVLGSVRGVAGRPRGRVATTGTRKETHRRETQRKDSELRSGADAHASVLDRYRQLYRDPYGYEPEMTGEQAAELREVLHKLRDKALGVVEGFFQDPGNVPHQHSPDRLVRCARICL